MTDHTIQVTVPGDPIPQGSKPPCGVSGCLTASKWRGLCRKHYEAYRRYGDPLIKKKGGVPKGFPQKGRPPKTGVPGYDAIHKRLLRKRGRASLLTCVDCGHPAQEWSYKGGDLSELRHKGIAYSLSLDYYEPRCIRCHRYKDDSLKHALPPPPINPPREANGRFGKRS